MTINTAESEKEFPCDGVTKTFAFDFPIFLASDLTVTLIEGNSETILTLGADYSVPGVSWRSGGSVVTVAAYPAGSKLLIQRDVDALQETSLRNLGDFKASVHEDAFDRIVMMIQQTIRGIGRALKLNKAGTQWQSNGIPFDAVKSDSDVEAGGVTLTTRMSKRVGAKSGSLVAFDGSGDSQDTGVSVSDILAGGEGFCVTERRPLASGQTVVNFVTVSPALSRIYVVGDDVDGSLLMSGDDYELDPVDKTKVTLSSSYPAGTLCVAVQNEQTADLNDALALTLPGKSGLVFSDVAALKAGASVNPAIISAGDIKASTISYHGGWSALKEPIGGADYTLSTLARVRAVRGGAWVPDGYADHYLFGGTTYVAVIDSPTLLQVGARGDYNAILQSGSDDAEYLQAWFNYLATLPTQRNRGRRVANVGAGQFLIGSLVTIPAALGFGIEMKGEGWKDGTGFWFDQNLAVGVLCEIEYTKFTGISFNGGKTIAGNSADRIPTMFKFRLPDARADIDCEFNDCRLFGASELVRVVGRGAKITGGAVAAFDDCLVIESDPLQGGTAADKRVSMRNYVIDNVRVDFGGNLITCDGTGDQRNHINTIMIDGLDAYKLDRLIYAPTATLRKLKLGDVSGFGNFVNNVIDCYSLIGGNISGGQYVKKLDDSTSPTTTADTITRFINATDSVVNVSIVGNTIAQLERELINAAATTGCTITGNVFPDLWAYDGGVSSSILIRTQSLLEPELTITGNASIADGGKVGSRVLDTNVKPTNVSMIGNKLGDNCRDYWTYVPTLTVGGTPVAASPTTALGRYWANDGYIQCEFSLLITHTGSGAAGITLPDIDYVPENATMTTTYCGGGEVFSGSGFGTVATRPTLSCNGTTKIASVQTWTGGALGSSVSVSAGTLSAFGSFKCRIR